MNGGNPSLGATAGAVAAGAVAPITINVGGYTPELVGLLLILGAAVTARFLFGFSDHGPGALRREALRFVLATLLAFGIMLSASPGPGLAVVIGIGVGGAIVPILDIIIAAAPTFVKRWLPPPLAIPPGTPTEMEDALRRLHELESRQ